MSAHLHAIPVRITDPRAFGRVAVLMGGWSAEREVALWSGQNVLEALRAQGVDAVGVDATPALVLSLKAQGYERVFNVLHGTGGEDGLVQAALELQGLPYTGSGVLASALSMDKLRTKRMWKVEGLPTPDWLWLRGPDDLPRAAAQLGFPFIVKPACEGSSVGISKVKSAAQFEEAWRQAVGADEAPRTVMAERFVAGGSQGHEFTCAILGFDALPTIRIEPPGEFYDYHAKYLSDDTRYHCPSGLDDKLEMEARELCLRAFELLGARGWGRVDFMLDADNRPWLIEANLVPGMTTHSLVPMAARVRGLDFGALCWRILEESMEAVR